MRRQMSYLHSDPRPPQALGLTHTPSLRARIGDARVQISIVTAVLNRSDTIEQSVRSTQRQSYRELAHVIQDGGSQDGSVIPADGLGRWGTSSGGRACLGSAAWRHAWRYRPCLA